MFKEPSQRMGKIISSILVGAGILLLITTLIPGLEINIALPLVFLMLGAAFLVFPISYAINERWTAYLYIPGCLLIAFGLVFLLNVITGDWAAWAYAWMLLITGAAVGAIITGRRLGWRQEIIFASESVVFLSITLFALFGAIAGGLFIQLMAPILLVSGGLALRWSGLEKHLVERYLRRKEAPLAAKSQAASQAHLSMLIDPLSKREIEVLQMIDQGLSNAEIASQLTLAQSTVKTHINNIYGKLNVQTRTQAVRRAHELGLLDQRTPR